MIPINTKVRVIKNSGGHGAYPGDEGYVMARLKHVSISDKYGINFTSGSLFSLQQGHDLDGRLESDTGNWVPETDLEVIC